MPHSPHTVASNDGTPIAFDEYGAGRPVILVPGATQHRAIDSGTTDLAGLLGATHRAVHYDRRGRGDSGDTTPYDVQREVDDIAALLDHVGGEAVLYGMSSGAVLALHAARRLSGVTGLALYEPPFVVDDSRPSVAADYLERLEEHLARGRRGEAARMFLVDCALVPAEVVDGMAASPFWPVLEGVAPTLPYDARVMGDTMAGAPLPADAFADITVPTLVLAGGESARWLQTTARQVADRLPDARFVLLEGQGHGAAAGVLVPVLVAFLEAGTTQGMRP